MTMRISDMTSRAGLGAGTVAGGFDEWERYHNCSERSSEQM